MKIVYKIFLFIILLTLSYPGLNAQTEVDGAYVDSLHNALNHAKTPSSKLPILKELSTLYWQQPEEVACLKEVVEISKGTNDYDLIYGGLIGLCRYYYNLNQKDSLLYWKNQLDSICQERMETPNAFYRAGNLLCRHYLGNHIYELAINEAIALVNEAQSKKNEYGLMVANQTLGYVYQEVGRSDDAVIAYREGLSYLNKLDVGEDFELQYISEMVLPCIRENHLEESERLLERYYSILKKLQSESLKKGVEFPVVWHNWLINTCFAELYMKKGQSDKAQVYILKAKKYADKSTDEDMKLPYYRVKAQYYLTLKDYKTALEAIDKALAVEVQPEFLKLKTDILRESGSKELAMTFYNELFTLNAKINDEAFDRQIRQLRDLSEQNDQEKEIYDLKRQNELLAMKQQLIVVAMGVSLILLVLLYMLIRFYLRTSKLKNDLQVEKDSLIKSEHQLWVAKEKAEEANQQKTAFISNISHEVRTPLNAIVGFSRLLADNAYPDGDKRHFAKIVEKNSELLLNLVNDVLDLSRLESGKVRLALKPCDIAVCCKNAIENMDHLIAPDVKLTFSPGAETYMLDTEALRLQQLLGHLLRNAAKFTKEGEINLSFEVDEKNRQVRFAVTDTGCGIPPEMQSKIFDAFEKLNDFIQGTGLGLPLSLKIANLLKGRLFVDPDYTSGARFVFIHPIGLVIE